MFYEKFCHSLGKSKNQVFGTRKLVFCVIKVEGQTVRATGKQSSTKRRLRWSANNGKTTVCDIAVKGSTSQLKTEHKLRIQTIHFLPLKPFQQKYCNYIIRKHSCQQMLESK